MSTKRPSTDSLHASDTPAAVIDALSKNPGFKLGKLLMTKVIVIKHEGQELELEITQTEPFDGLIDKKMIADFEAKVRSPGEIFMAWHRGNPHINIVQDPAKKRVVFISGTKMNNKSYSATAILKDFLGIARADKTPAAYEDFVKAVNKKLDSKQVMELQHGQPFLICDSKTSPLITEITYDTKERAANSLGRIIRL